MAEERLSSILNTWRAKLAVLTLALEGLSYSSQEVEVDPQMIYEANVFAHGIYTDMHHLASETVGVHVLRNVYWDRAADQLTYREEESEAPTTANSRLTPAETVC